MRTNGLRPSAERPGRKFAARAGARFAAALVGFAAGVGGFAATSGATADAQIFGTPAPPAARATTIVGRMGLEMPEADARHQIAFRPFTPPRRILVVALLPPFHGADMRANRGIGFEYEDVARRRYALAQWPANGGTIDNFEPLRDGTQGCADARSFSRGTKPNGIVWTTPRGLIMTLQTDGTDDARTLTIEWGKLIRRGACR